MSDLLPCCQCGESIGYTLSEGSTYRWWVVNCKACGGDFGECAADRVTNLHKDPIPQRWHWADEHWNEANAHAQKLQERIAALEKVAEAQRWVAVSERLPPEDMVEIYEVVCSDIHTKRRYQDEIYWQSSYWEVPDSVAVEYWREIQPLPAPPHE